MKSTIAHKFFVAATVVVSVVALLAVGWFVWFDANLEMSNYEKRVSDGQDAEYLVGVIRSNQQTAVVYIADMSKTDYQTLVSDEVSPVKEYCRRFFKNRRFASKNAGKCRVQLLSDELQWQEQWLDVKLVDDFLKSIETAPSDVAYDRSKKFIDQL